MVQTITIVMTGQLPIPPYTSVFWTVYGEPDNTGAQSGYGAGYLINVGVDSVSQDGAAVDPITLQVGGDLTGNLPDPYVSGLQGTPIAVTTPTSNQLLQFNSSTGKWTPTTIAIPSLTVGGDLSGTLPNPTVVGLQGRQVDSNAPTSGQYLVWNGARWAPTSFAATLAGDVTGSFSANTVVKLYNVPLNTSPPTTSQFLQYNGTSWTPTSLSLSGDTSGAYSSTTVNAIQNVPLNVTSPTTGDIIAYDGSRWSKTTPAIPITTTATSAATASTIALRDSQGATNFATGLLGSAQYGGNIIVDKATAYFSISQTGQTTNVATNQILIATQAPYASATGSNRLPGDFVINIPPSAGALATTNSGNIHFEFDGNPMVSIYQLPSSSTGIIEFPNDGQVNNCTSVNSQSIMNVSANNDLNLYGTPANMTSTGDMTFQADNIITLNGFGGIVINDSGGSGLTIESGGGEITFSSAGMNSNVGINFSNGSLGQTFTLQANTVGGNSVTGNAIVLAGGSEPGTTTTGGDCTIASGTGTSNPGSVFIYTGATQRFKANATGIGFFNSTPVAKPTVTGSKGGNAALASLLTALSNLGLVTDSSS